MKEKETQGFYERIKGYYTDNDLLSVETAFIVCLTQLPIAIFGGYVEMLFMLLGTLLIYLVTKVIYLSEKDRVKANSKTEQNIVTNSRVISLNFTIPVVTSAILFTTYMLMN